MLLGEKIKELRENRNISQKELGESIGVSDVMISMYEQGKKNPSLPTIRKISEYFGVTIDALLGSKNTLSTLEEEMPEGVTLLRRMKNISPEARRKMIQIANALLEQEEKEMKEREK